MRYEVYGIGAGSKFATEVGAARSKKKAFELIGDINPLTTPNFLIIETPRRTAVPLGFLAGKVVEGFATLARATYVMSGTTPTKSTILSEAYLSEVFED